MGRFFGKGQAFPITRIGAPVFLFTGELSGSIPDNAPINFPISMGFCPIAGFLAADYVDGERSVEFSGRNGEVSIYMENLNNDIGGPCKELVALVKSSGKRPLLPLYHVSTQEREMGKWSQIIGTIIGTHPDVHR